MAGSQGVRARVRAEMTLEIMEAARVELAQAGPAELSLRAVARRMEMVPSALYRYFPSRDALLTALIIESYDALGAAAEAADPGGVDAAARWSAVARCVRRWAGEHPHQWALIYGTPVTGYEAPQATVEAALRITRVVAGIFGAVLPAAGAPTADPGRAPVGRMPAAPPGLGSVFAPMENVLLPGRPPEAVAAVLIAWTHLIGVVGLELFGHYKGGTTGFDAVFDYTIEAVGALGGLG